MRPKFQVSNLYLHTMIGYWDSFPKDVLPVEVRTRKRNNQAVRYIGERADFLSKKNEPELMNRLFSK